MTDRSMSVPEGLAGMRVDAGLARLLGLSRSAAATLAEDPGSSVLTITSLGMARLSRPSNGASRDRVIALWKEEGASAVEIELPDNRRAVVLSVSMKACKDWSADGRLRQSAIPSLTGVRFLKGDRLPADR